MQLPIQIIYFSNTNFFIFFLLNFSWRHMFNIFRSHRVRLLRSVPYFLLCSCTGYAAVLAGLPEELRRAYRDGNFAAGLKDHDFQVIPTAWIETAQRRWRPDGWRGVAMTAIGLDVAQGGADFTVLAARHGGWYAPLVRKPGHETRDGSAVAAAVVAAAPRPLPGGGRC